MTQSHPTDAAPDARLPDSLMDRLAAFDLLTRPTWINARRLSVSTFANWNALLSHASRQGTNPILPMDQTHAIALEKVTLSGLNQDHAPFV